MVDRARQAGGLPVLDKEGLEEAKAKFMDEIHAPSQRPVLRAKLQTVEKALAMWQLTMYPPTVEKVHALGTVLKAGRYKSAESYLSVYKTEAERKGFTWTAVEQRALRDAARSCARGLGGPQHALPLPFSRLGELPGTEEPWVGSGPVFPRSLVVLGSWFMMRETEAANATVADVTVKVVDGVPKVLWDLPASKTDQRAAGVSRAHGCSCSGTPMPACPAHAAWAHVSMLRRRFGDVGPDFPFFPDSGGRTCCKDAVAATLVEAARMLEVPTVTATGRITGHSLRVTGAQGLAAAGLDLWAIQLLGRWGSLAIKSYVREAHLEQAEVWARRVAQHTDLQDLKGMVAGQIEACVKESDAWKLIEAKAAQLLKEANEVQGNHVELQPECAEALAVEVLPAAVQVERLEVVTSAANVTHEVAFGPPEADLALAITTCGWRFGRSSSARMAPRSDLPTMYKQLCAKCFPSEREAAKRLLAERAAES